MRVSILWLIGFCILTITSCIKPRTVDIPSDKPDQISGDTVRKGILLINEVNNRWSATVNLTNELSSVLSRRYDQVIGDDWKDGKTKWFEIYNNSTRTINFADTMKGKWYLSDSRQIKMQSLAAAAVSIAPGGYLIVYGSDTSYNKGSQLHTDFNIGRNSGADRDTLGIYYFDKQRRILVTVDSLTYADNDRNSTWSRFPDGSSTILKTAPSPGSANTR